MKYVCSPRDATRTRGEIEFPSRSFDVKRVGARRNTWLVKPRVGYGRINARRVFDANYDEWPEGGEDRMRDAPLSLIRMSRRRAVANRTSSSQPAQVGRDVLISKLVGIILDDTFIFASITRWKSL